MTFALLLLASALIYGEKDGYREVSRASSFRNQKKFEEGSRFVAELRQRDRKSLTPVEIQAEDMAEFTLWRDDAEHREQCIDLLKKAYAQGPTTIWGWSALGFLDNFGAKDQVTVPPGDPYKHLGEIAHGVLDFQPLWLEPKEAPVVGEAARRLSVELARWPDRNAILRTHLIELCGVENVDAMLSMKDGERLFAKLWEDERMLSDFLLSGPVFEPKEALKSLMTMFLNDSDGWCATEEGRKITVASAVNTRELGKKYDFDAALTNRLQCWAAYRRLSQRKLFHETTAKRDAREWRFIVRDPTSAADIMYLNSHTYNFKHPGSMIGQVAYRHNNCFGDYIFGPNYYKPWRFSDWPYWYMVHRVGGICNRQSTFAAVCSNAHGLMAERAGQPNHCCWLLRDERGVWTIRNDINKYTAGVFMFWGHGYQYIQITERAFASREAWDRSELLRFQCCHELEGAKPKPETCEGLLRQAIDVCPYNLNAWAMYAELLSSRKTSREDWRRFLSELVRAMPEGRTAAWDLGLDALASMRKVGVTDDELLEAAIGLVKALPEPEHRIPEEMNYEGEVMRRLAKLFESTPDLRHRLIVAALEANWGTPHYFTQILHFGLTAYSKDVERSNRLMEDFGKLAKQRQQDGDEMKSGGLNWHTLIDAASRGHQREAFQTLGELRNRLSPPPKGEPYPDRDFGGRLVSHKGVLYTSGRVRGDCPEDYPRVIDASPLKTNRWFQVAAKPVENPWVVVELQGLCKLNGIRIIGDSIVNAVISVSEDGESWRDLVTYDENEQDQFIIDTNRSHPIAKFIRVGRVPNAATTPLKIGKILVYGQTLY